MTITTAERNELIASRARYVDELAQAIDELERYTDGMLPDCRLHREGAARHRRYVNTAQSRIDRLDQMLATCEVEPEPEPPAPAVKPAAQPNRFPVSIAWFYSTCGLTGKRIHPGAEITNYQGKWSLYAEVVADDERNRADGIRRRADRELATCIEVFADRLPIAA